MSSGSIVTDKITKTICLDWDGLGVIFQGRDLSPETDELWRKCYCRIFGDDAVELVKARMLKRGCKFKWKQSYQVKLREQDEVQKKGINLLRGLYKEQDKEKKSRKTHTCELTPPDSKRRRSAPGAQTAPMAKSTKTEGRLMQKARIEYANSNEARMHAAIRKKPAGGSDMNQQRGSSSSIAKSVSR